MITKNTMKRIQSLGLKKNRLAEKQFIVEGKKAVDTFLSSAYNLNFLFSTEKHPHPSAVHIGSSEMKRMSQLKNPSSVLGVFSLPSRTTLPNKGRILILDEVRDPGNLGTLIRLCDWFGIHQLVCSLQTVDCFNPKAVQASMGSLAQVACHYTSLPAFLQSTDLPIYGTFLEGTSVYETVLPKDAVLIFGNEAHGISKATEQWVNHRITIPKSEFTLAESLNVTLSAAVIFGALLR